MRHLRRAEYGGAHVGDSMYSILQAGGDGRFSRSIEAPRTDSYISPYAQGSPYASPQNQEGRSVGREQQQDRSGAFHPDGGYAPSSSSQYPRDGGVLGEGQHPQPQLQGDNFHPVSQQEGRYASHMHAEHGETPDRQQDFYHPPSA